jgi:glycosyltransferase involved in cell wall biosynthesis
MSRVEILIIGQLPPPVHGSNVMTELFMSSLRKQGYDAYIVEKTFSKRPDQVGKISILKFFKIPILIFRLIILLFKKPPDLCFFFISLGITSFLVDALLLIILRLFNVEYVLYIHGVGFEKLCANSGNIVNLMVRKTLSDALGALVLGDRLKPDIRRHIADERIFVLPNAIPSIGTDGSIPLECAGKPIRILYLSNLRPEKGTMEFLLMSKQVVKEFPGVRFILAGPSTSERYSQEICAFIEREKLQDYFEIPGGIYGAEKDKFFKESDIFVFPSHNEAFPLVIMEAMQWSLPVVVSTVGSIPEMVIDGSTGYLVDYTDVAQLTDRVLRLVKDRDLRIRMGNSGKERFEEFYSIPIYEKRLSTAVNTFLALRGKTAKI